jgi:hypothetical protein
LNGSSRIGQRLLSLHRDRSLFLVALVAAVLMACGPDSNGGSSGTSSARPATSAQLTILSPAPNEVTSPDVNVTLDLQDGEVVSRTSGEPSSTEGHIHLSVDGKIVSMAYGLSQAVHLEPGVHTVQAEFVAVDHLPFANRVVAAVVFTVEEAGS